MYKHYIRARNTSWKVLDYCQISSLPINLGLIANHYHIEINLYSTSSFLQLFKDEVKNGDGFIIAEQDDIYKIYLNDKKGNIGRRRFTLSHELGHGIMKHNIQQIHYRNSENDSNTDMEELEANVFARDILMSSFVLMELNVSTANDIMDICKVSRKSAEIRLERLIKLKEREKFYTCPLEARLKARFQKFIDENKKA